MKIQEVIQNITQDTAVELTQEFDRNFERKAFFDKKWPSTKLPNNRGSLMMRSGKLRRSINYKVENSQISWRSAMPYAALMNEGGEVTVTAKMKRFFWAMYYKASGGITKTKTGKVSNSQRNIRLAGEAEKWKALALQKVGAKMTIEQRQFLGWHPQVDRAIDDIVKFNMEDFSKKLKL